MPLKIRISNLNKKRKVNRKEIEKAALKILTGYRKKDTLIDITFVGNARIKALNKKYMRRTGPTDVLSFVLEEKHLPRKKRLIGDIYISSDMASSNAGRFNTSFRKEILLYTVHGMLHILGFGDKTAKEKKKIRRLEKRFLKELGR